MATKKKDIFAQGNDWEVNEMLRLEKSEKRAWYVSAAMMVLCVLALGAVLGLTPLKTSVPYVIRVNETTGIVDIVKSMQDSKTTYSEVVRKADLRKFVRARESYSMTLAEDYYKAVGLLSTEEMQRKYQLFFNPQTNPKGSPLVKYGENGSVVIKVKSVAFINENAATVNYIKEERFDQMANSRPLISEWVATVTFKYVDAPLSDEDRDINQFGFQASEYRNDPVSATSSEITQ